MKTNENIREDKYKQINKTRGITLISLVITIILLIILAGIAINLSVGENGLFNKTKQAKAKYNETSARERLEVVLAEALVEKEVNKEYDSEDFLNNLLTNDAMSVNGNTVTVNDYNFLIDREKLKIVESLGETTVKVINEVQKYLGKNEDGKYRVSSLVTIQSNIEIESIKITNPDGTNITLIPGKQELTKDIEMELGQEYKVEVKTTDGKIDTRTIIEKSEEKIRSIEDFVSFRDKVNSGLTYEGKTLKLTTNLELNNVCGKDINGKTISFEPIGTTSNPFKGIFDGNFHEINNLYIETDKYRVLGLFGYVKGNINNVKLNNCYVKSTYSSTRYSYVGALVGCLKGNVNRCGVESGEIILNSKYNEWNFQGGVVGYAEEGSIENSYNKASILGGINDICAQGGITGGGRALINNCYNTGNITNNSRASMLGIGGIAGVVWNKKVSNSYAIGKINYKGGRVCGVVGVGADNSPYSNFENVYCSNGLAYSFRYNDSVLSNTGVIDSNLLKTYASTLGEAYIDDGKKIDKDGNVIDNKDRDDNIIYINKGYPVLKWQVTE